MDPRQCVNEMTAGGRAAEIEVVDSHTGGEPTRIVVGGGPDLGQGTLAERRDVFRRDFDRFRSRVVNEPRGSEVLVGGLVCQPTDTAAAAGVIYFNNVGMIGMCGHGTIGLLVTLYYLERISIGQHRIETPVGLITATLHDAHRVTVENVASFRTKKDVSVTVPDFGDFVGDIAYGGNWFFLIKQHQEQIEIRTVRRLERLTIAIMDALDRQGITGNGGEKIDHIELFANEDPRLADSRNFVMCPGGAYDRSPCGTGTCAKIACMAADGGLGPGEVWRQAGICGSVFEASYRIDENGRVRPSITGSAYICGQGKLMVQDGDPLADGIRR